MKAKVNSIHTLTLLLGALLITISPSELWADKAVKYKDENLPISKRVDDLLLRMTLEEKIAQLQCIWLDKEKIFDKDFNFDLEKAKQFLGSKGIGNIGRPSDRMGLGKPGVTPNRTPTETVKLVNAIQQFMINHTRLGIPVMFHEEALHGYQARYATHFPQAIALASTWNPSLVEKVYTITAREIRARGVHQALGPVLDIGREPRWGRVEETYGEDPYLVSKMGLAAIKGLQGTKLPLQPNRVLATLKHFIGSSIPEGGRNTAPPSFSQREMFEIFAPPFKTLIREGNAKIVMAAFNEFDGIPLHANQYLLNDILREKWDFDGLVVSDYFGIVKLKGRHRVASTLEEAAMQSIFAGIDIEYSEPKAFVHLETLVKKGKVSEKQIDSAVRRVLNLKFVAGLFENPFADAAYAESITGNKESRTIALEAARQAIILLKNDKNLLPIDKTKVKRVAVIGPNANRAVLGGYSDVPKHSVSILDGVRTKLGKSAVVEYSQGVCITESHNWWQDEVKLCSKKKNLAGISKAVQLARKSDLVILAIGGNEQTSREAFLGGHLGDRSNLDLLGEQQKLVDAILKTGTPAIIVLIHGRPLSITEIAERAPAILDGWYLGQETGTAVAEVIFGDVNPGGKLTVSIPRSAGQLPVFYNHKPTARRNYLFETSKPLFPFGYGLSYTKFEISKPKLKKVAFKQNEKINVSVNVKNIGSREGDEVVQLYVKDVFSTVTRPVKELKRFLRVSLKPGETRKVKFTLTNRDFSCFDQKMSRVVESGNFYIMAGTDSEKLKISPIYIK